VNRLSEPVREALHMAHDVAGEYIGTDHLLLALAQVHGVAAVVLAEHDLAAARLETVVSTGPGRPSGSVPFSPGAKRALELALGEALNRGHEDIGTGHLLLALLSEDMHSAAQAAVGSTGVDLDALRRGVDGALASGASDVSS
jgi:ATP-dependent Clp protease ATP-binding subunit ClpA